MMLRVFGLACVMALGFGCGGGDSTTEDSGAGDSDAQDAPPTDSGPDADADPDVEATGEDVEASGEDVDAIGEDAGDATGDDAGPDTPCTNHWTGPDCDVCPPGWDPEQDCNACLPGLMGSTCNLCVRYVSPIGLDTYPGTTWATAKRTIQAGIDAANDARGSGNCHVWVKEGEFYVYETAVSDTIRLRTGVPVYGSFDGSETSPADRDLAGAPTILDGRASFMGTDRVSHVVTGAPGGVLDGFRIRNGSAATGTGIYDRNGGGLYNNFATTGTMTVANCTFQQNSAVVRGGAIFNRRVVLSLSDSSFDSNSAGQFGGAISGEESAVDISNTDFSGHVVDDSGSRGGALAVEGTLTIADSTFSDNEARGELAQGGAISCVIGGTLTLTRVDFIRNGATAAGGAVHADACSVIGTQVDFVGNRVDENLSGGPDPVSDPGRGGALSCWTGTTSHVAIDQATFVQNRAPNGGGAVFLAGPGGDTIRRSFFLSNESSFHSGGGLWIASSSVARVENCLFAGNVARGPTTRGGGIYVSESSPTIVNCTVARNHVTDNSLAGGGGLAAVTSGTATVRNTLFWKNTNSGYNNPSISAGPGTTIDTTYGLDTNIDGVGFAGVSTPGSPSTFESIRYDVSVLEGTDSLPAPSFFTADTMAGYFLHLDEPRAEVLEITSNTTGSITAFADALRMGAVATPAPYSVDTYRPMSVAGSIVNQGTSTDAPTVDILGRTRVGGVDIGAYEYIP